MGSPKKSTVLIVDDQEELRSLIELAFLEEGFDTLTALNGKEAFSIFEKQNVDVIVSDVRMPIMDGIELLKNVRIKNVNVPFFLMTGHSDVDSEGAKKIGANGYFLKPFTYDELLLAVNESISKK